MELGYLHQEGKKNCDVKQVKRLSSECFRTGGAELGKEDIELVMMMMFSCYAVCIVIEVYVTLGSRQKR